MQATPDQSTLCRWANLIQPQTLQAFNQRIMNLVVDNKLTRGGKLRMDGTVVETTIHPIKPPAVAEGPKSRGHLLWAPYDWRVLAVVRQATDLRSVLDLPLQRIQKRG